jgi:exosortase
VATTLERPDSRFGRHMPRRLDPAAVFLALCLGVFIVPTMIDVATKAWSTEQGAHGPIVLAVSIWLIYRELKGLKGQFQRGSPWIAALLFIPCLVLYVLARITHTIEVEGYVMYGCLIALAYGAVGGAVMRRLWFPLLFTLFVFPPPDTLFAIMTQPLKIGISSWAVNILFAMGMPIANSGVTIQVGQYSLLVAAACAGVNSLISLTALGLFYSYIRYASNLPYMALLVLFILPVAVFANLVRVILLVLITYYFGEQAGQGFVHELAGITMFLLALGAIFVVDWAGTPLRKMLVKGKAA